MTLSSEQRSTGCVVASSGNHGVAVALAMQTLGSCGVIFVPEQTSELKVHKIRAYGAELRYFGADALATEQHARQYAERNGMFYLSPYNDEQVIAGQGTCGIELLDQLPCIDAVFIAVGGGGLIGGVGSVLKSHNSSIRVFGCQPKASAVMAQSVAAGEVIDAPSGPTISDGTAGGIEDGAITLPLNQAVVDEFVIVDEPQIKDAMRLYMSREPDFIEGAAGVAIAGMQACSGSLAGLNVAVVICGGNIDEASVNAILTR